MSDMGIKKEDAIDEAEWKIQQMEFRKAEQAHNVRKLRRQISVYEESIKSSDQAIQEKKEELQDLRNS